MAEPTARNLVKVCEACSHTNVADAELCAACGAELKAPARQVRLEETESDRASRNPYLRWVMHLGAPLTASIGIHALLLITTALITVSVRRAPAPEVGDYQAGIENVDMSGGLSFDQAQPPPQDKPEDLNMTTDVTTNVPMQDTPAADTGKGDVGLGAGESAIIGTGTGAQEAGAGGVASGMGSAGIIGQAGIWGLKVNANDIVYVVDFSGSIVVVEGELKRELKNSVGHLRASQTFNVILFYGMQNRAETASFKNARVPATSDNKAAFVAWIEQQRTGFGSDPRPAVKLAIAQKPEAIFFLSDGAFESSYVDELTQANARQKAQFACFQFDEAKFHDRSNLPPTVDDNGRRLQRLAELNKGRDTKAAFKIVTGKDVYGG